MMIDALADKIFGGRVRTGLSCRLDLRFRTGLGKPWEHSLMLLRPGSGTILRRLDVRGTHLDGATGEHFIHRTHKHKRSEQRGNRDVYSQTISVTRRTRSSM
ncbi:hypothetical protein ACWGNM_15575 [Streptomyces sp. NPDC055796]